MRIAVFTGELSGELYAYHILRALSELEKDLEAFGIGGPNLSKLDFFRKLSDISELSIVGVVEVFKKLRRLWRLFHRCVNEVLFSSPDVILLIDSPDFNLRLAKALRRENWWGKIIYFIPPTAWIWRSKRVEVLRECCDLVITLFDFEAEWFSSRGVSAVFLGHPLLDILPSESTLKKIEGLREPVLACFPGSRHSEVKHLLPVMKKVADSWSGDVIFSKAPSVPREFYKGVEKLYEVPSYLLLTSCDFALAASGTIAVEGLIYEKPMVVVYKGNPLNYLIYKLLVNAKFISMPNIMGGTEIYPELIQGRANPCLILNILKNWLKQGGDLAKMKERLKDLKRRLGNKGAIRRIASWIIYEASSSR
ncbi:MAG: hypothetical protein J7M13_01860 [Synergistetes bacterium]|nr:hypothetical protein [Synergistota bacterium]